MSCQTILAPFEARWQEIRRCNAAQPAVLSPQGHVLRTFEDVEAESIRLRPLFMRIPERSVVSLDLENHPSWPALVLTAFRTQRILLPLDPSTTEKTKNQVEILCGATVRTSAISDEQLKWDFLTHAPLQWPAPFPDFLKISSGTENGQLRAIRFTSEQLLADCDQICQTMAIGAGDLQYGVIPFSHSYGFSSIVTPLLWRGIPFVVARDRLPRAIASGIHSTGATILPTVPSLFQILSSTEPLPLRLCISAGAPLRSSTAKAFYEKHRLKIHSFYGSSECGGICYDASEEPLPPEGWVGEPLQGVSVTWNPENYHIQVQSNAVGLGYHPQESSNSLTEGCFEPADLLEKCDRGFRVIGRITDWINVGAKKVHPTEIEGDLLRYPGIHDAIVFGVESEGRGHQIHAVVAAEADIPLELLRKYCGERLAPWKIPRHFHLVKSLPVNARGKINRSKLAAQFTPTA